VYGKKARRGTIIDCEVCEDEFTGTAIAEGPLNDIFGYSSKLRGATQGNGEFSMEYKVPSIYFFLKMGVSDVWMQTHLPVSQVFTAQKVDIRVYIYYLQIDTRSTNI
jgi:hypothetical protein